MKFSSLVFEVWCSQNFRDAQAHALTHRWTEPNTVCLLHHFSTMAEAQKVTNCEINILPPSCTEPNPSHGNQSPLRCTLHASKCKKIHTHTCDHKHSIV